MFAPKDPTNRNEPLLARHARWVHQKDRKAFRLTHLKGMNPEHAVAVLGRQHVFIEVHDRQVVIRRFRRT